MRTTVLMLWSTFLAAATSGQAAAPDAAALIGQIEAKYAGYNDEIRDMTLEQEMTAGEVRGDLKLMKKGGKYRIENTVSSPEMAEMDGSMTTTVIYDGRDVWIENPFTGKMKAPGGKTQESTVHEEWWRDLAGARVAGEAIVSGRACHIVEPAPAAGQTYSKLWIDKENLVLVSAEGRDEQGKVVRMMFSDFRPVGKWKLPYKTEILSGGQVLASYVTRSVETNTGLSDDLFTASSQPASGGMDMQALMQQALQQASEEDR